MTSELTDFELKVFQSAWHGLKDITSPQFVKTFEPVWSRNSKEIEEYSEKIGYPIRLFAKNVAFTLKPNTMIDYNPESDTYLINLWYFLFSGDNQSVVIKHPIYLVGNFIHEHNHEVFCRYHNMICKTERITSQFIRDYNAEMEKRAIFNEVSALNKAITIVESRLQVRAFNVKSWSENGIPACQINDVTVCPDVDLGINIKNCNVIRKKLISLSQRGSMVSIEKNKNEWYKEIATVLKLSEPPVDSPISSWNHTD
ncbi:MAG: hypothetical protein P8Y18_01745 [Candidatus Bathyarchaeota archaeon]